MTTAAPELHPLFCDLRAVFDLSAEAHAPRARHEAVLQAAQRVAGFIGDAVNPKPAELKPDAAAPVEGDEVA